ncbi:ATP-dependent DNA ligase Cdc17, partial [Teratosphaeriaceae sp. CCFEE 6253]
KRTASDAAGEDDQESEAPPTKKRREKPSEHKPKKGVATTKKGVATKTKGASKPKPVFDDDDEMDDAPASSKPAKSPTPAGDDAGSDGDHEPVKPIKRAKTASTPPPAKSKPAAKAPVNSVEDKANETDPDSDAEEEAGGSEDDVEEEEKPAAAAKARKKIQSTLATPAKDAYPDWKAGERVP